MAGRLQTPAVQGSQPARARTDETPVVNPAAWGNRKTPMNLPGQLNPSPRLLLGPGPCDAHPRVLRAMVTPLLGHLDPQFLEIMNETQAMLREVFQTKNRLTFPVSATGMAVSGASA